MSRPMSCGQTCSWCGTALLVALILLPGGCGRREKVESPRPSPPAPIAETAPAAVGKPAIADAQPAESQELGLWAKTDVYDLRLESVGRCDASTPGRATAPEGGTRLLALKVKVRSKTKSLFVGPRDATLHESSGLLFQPLTESKLAGCRPTFKATAVRIGAEVGGTVVFEVPAQTGKLTFQFSPTRWGGSTPVRVPLPAAPLAKGGLKSTRVRS